MFARSGLKSEFLNYCSFLVILIFLVIFILFVPYFVRLMHHLLVSPCFLSFLSFPFLSLFLLSLRFSFSDKL
jgi:hypothetical protein